MAVFLEVGGGTAANIVVANVYNVGIQPVQRTHAAERTRVITR